MSSTQGRKFRPTVLIVAISAALLAAGFVAYLNLRSGADQAEALAEASRPLPENRPRPKRIVPPPHPASFRSKLALFRAEDDRSGLVLAIGKPSGPKSLGEIHKTDQGIILRELVRQAFLIAARDESGLTTRDEVVDEFEAPNADRAPFEIDSIFRVDGPSRVLVRRVEGEASENLLDRELSPVPNEVGILATVLPLVEGLSRTEFPRALASLGALGSPNKINADAPIPPGVEDRLSHLEFITIFSAVRDLHAAIRADGESPARLGALARGYSLLGILSEFQWHPAHKAYKARALLYAQRLIARDPASAWAFRNRAFVLALIGLPKEAQDDLAEADTLARAAKETTPPPAWASLIDSYARYDLKGLQNINGPYARLAALLRLVMVEYPVGYRQSVPAAREVLALEPFCPRASDSLCRLHRLGIQHEITLTAPLTFSQSIPLKLKDASGLPPEVCVLLGLDDEKRKAIEEIGRRAAPEGVRQDRPPFLPPPDRLPGDPQTQTEERAIIAGLSRGASPAKDRGEPSWNALAHWLRETQFAQVYRRLDFLKTTLGIPVNGLGAYWATAKPLLEGHRYQPYLTFLSRSFQDGRADFAKFIKTVDPAELERTEFEMLTWMDKFGSAGNQPYQVIGLTHNDAVVPDLSSIPDIFPQTSRVMTIRSFLMPIAPGWPYADSVLIDIAWEMVKPKAADWEKSPDTSPIILAALGRHYAAAKQFDDAERVLTRYTRLFPELWAYELLATNHWNRGDTTRWRETLDEFLAKGEDIGLEHSTVQAKIANDLMNRKKWAEAKPYAEAAAATGSAGGVQCAIRCAEGMEDWQTAESRCRYLVERYPESCWGELFLYCKRTGRGDLAAARKQVEGYLERHKIQENSSYLLESGFFYWLTGDLKQAMERFTKEYEWNKQEITNLHMAMIADEMHDETRRDEILAGFCERFKSIGDPWVPLCERMISDLAADKVDPYQQVAALDHQIRAIHADWRPMANYFVGRYLLNRGRTEVAHIYLGRCTESPLVNRWIRAIASDIVRTPATSKAK